MNQYDLTDDDIERLLQGNADHTDHVAGDLARVVDRIRTEYTSTTVLPVGAELAQFVNLNLVFNTNDLLAEATVSSEFADTPTATRHHTQQVRAGIRQRRRKVRLALGTFTGTLTAKVLLGGALALAAASGTQALGIVDIPLLPNFGQQHHVDNTPPHIVDDPPATTDHQPKAQTVTDDRGQTDTDGNKVDTGTDTRNSDHDNSQTDHDTDTDGTGTDGTGTDIDGTGADTGTGTDSTDITGADSTDADTIGADITGADSTDADTIGADTTDTRDELPGSP